MENSNNNNNYDIIGGAKSERKNCMKKQLESRAEREEDAWRGGATISHQLFLSRLQ